jgi:hypothetical protein
MLKDTELYGKMLQNANEKERIDNGDNIDKEDNIDNKDDIDNTEQQLQKQMTLEETL